MHKICDLSRFELTFLAKIEVEIGRDRKGGDNIQDKTLPCHAVN